MSDQHNITAGDCGYIDDGYNERAWIKPVPGQHPGLRFNYRPLLTSERAVVYAASDKIDQDEQQVHAAKIMAGKIQQWDLRDRAGQVVPIGQAELLRLKPGLFAQLWGIVSGAFASDLDPEWTVREQDSRLREKLDAIASGDSIGVSRERADLKN